MNKKSFLIRLAKSASKFDSMGNYEVADRLDSLLKSAGDETYTDKKGVVWTKIGPVSMPHGYIEWENTMGRKKVVKPGEFPETADMPDSDTTKKKIVEEEKDTGEKPVVHEEPDEKAPTNTWPVTEWIRKKLVEPAFGK